MMDWTMLGFTVGSLLVFWGASIVASWLLMIIQVHVEPNERKNFTEGEARRRIIFMLIPAINLIVSVWLTVGAFFRRFWKIDLRWLFLVFPKSNKESK